MTEVSDIVGPSLIMSVAMAKLSTKCKVPTRGSYISDSAVQLRSTLRSNPVQLLEDSKRESCGAAFQGASLPATTCTMRRTACASPSRVSLSQRLGTMINTHEKHTTFSRMLCHRRCTSSWQNPIHSRDELIFGRIGMCRKLMLNLFLYYMLARPRFH